MYPRLQTVVDSNDFKKIKTWRGDQLDSTGKVAFNCGWAVSGSVVVAVQSGAELKTCFENFCASECVVLTARPKCPPSRPSSQASHGAQYCTVLYSTTRPRLMNEELGRC